MAHWVFLCFFFFHLIFSIVVTTVMERIDKEFQF